jgi:hypothetical protein
LARCNSRGVDGNYDGDAVDIRNGGINHRRFLHLFGGIMSKDTLTLTPKDTKDEKLMSFLNRCAEIRQANEEAAFSGAFNPVTGVLND